MDYDIFETIGKGRDTVVNRAYDESCDREVAVKRLNPDLKSSRQRQEQLLRQGQFLAGCENHPHLAAVHAIDPSKGWIVMELMCGSLNSLMESGPVRQDVARRILAHALDALDYLHKQGKIHGMIHPANILFDAERRAKLSDFDAIQPGAEIQTRGNAKYLAPELIKPEFGEIGPQLDLYQLGFTIVEALVGNQKFNGLFEGINEIEADTGWLRWHSDEGSSLAINEIVPGIQPDLAEALSLMLMKRVGDRPPTASQILGTLKEDLGPLPPEVIRKSTIGKATTTPTPTPPTPPTPPTLQSPSSQARWWPPDLGDSRVFRPIALALFVLVGLAAAFVLPGSTRSKPRLVKLNLVPESCSVSLGGEELKKRSKDGGDWLLLQEGKHKLKVSKKGFEPKTIDFVFSKTANNLTAQLDPLKFSIGVSLVPDNSKIEIDGHLLPVVDEKCQLPFGKHTLKITATGYEAKEIQIDVKSDPQPISVELNHILHTIELSVMPENATIEIGGKQLESVDLRLPAGVHWLEVSSEGYTPAIRELEVGESKPNRFSVNLVKQGMARVEIRTVPPDADLNFDEKRLQPVDDKGKVYELPLGTSLLAASANGFTPLTKEITIEEGGNDAISLSLDPIDDSGEVAAGRPIQKVKVNVIGESQSGKLYYGEKELMIASGLASVDFDQLATVSSVRVELDSREPFDFPVNLERIKDTGLLVISPPLSNSDEARYIWMYARQGILGPSQAAIAEKQLTRSLQLDPGLAPAYRDRAIARMTLGKDNIAMRDFEQAKALAGGSRDFHLFKEYSKLLVNSRQLEESLAEIDSALGIRPHSSEALPLKLQLLFNKGDNKSAFEVAQELLSQARDPGQLSFAHNVIGLLLRRIGKHREALGHFGQAAQLDESNAVAFYNYAGAAIVIGKNNPDPSLLRSALDSLNSAIKADPKIAPRVVPRIAQVQLMGGSPRAALETLNRFIGKYGRNKSVLLMRAAVYRKLGDKDAAKRDETIAAELD